EAIRALDFVSMLSLASGGLWDCQGGMAHVTRGVSGGEGEVLPTG
ncbi:hypothetical protein Tco_0610538, partial [Tanacetum coccineum]